MQEADKIYRVALSCFGLHVCCDETAGGERIVEDIHALPPMERKGFQTMERLGLC